MVKCLSSKFMYGVDGYRQSFNLGRVGILGNLGTGGGGGVMGDSDSRK